MGLFESAVAPFLDISVGHAKMFEMRRELTSESE
jgi:hypothetical protein